MTRARQEADDYSLTNRGFEAAMSYLMSPQTHPGLLPSSQGERGAPGTRVGSTTSPEYLLLDSGEAEILLGFWDWLWSHFSSKKSHSPNACQ